MCYNHDMTVQDISTMTLREKMGDIFNRVFYRADGYRVQRKGETLGYIVSENYVNKVGQMIDYLIENEPALADTLALQANDDIRDLITQSMQEIEQGNMVPLESILDD